MDTIGEVAIRLGGAALRIAAEILIEIVLEPAGRFVSAVYSSVFRQVRRIVPSDLFAALATLLLLFAASAGSVAVVVTIVQALIA